MATQAPGRGVGGTGEPAVEAHPGPAPRTWHVRVPACEWLTANPRSTTNRYGRSRIIRDWRQAVVAACTQARLPRGVSPVTIDVMINYVGHRPVRDTPNIFPTVKAIVDGLVPIRVWTRAGRRHITPGYGFLPDDSDKHVRRLDWDLQLSGNRQAWVDLTIREVTPC